MTSSGPPQYPRIEGGQQNMALAIESVPHVAVGADREFNIAVVFTSVPATLVALREAGNLADSLGARITLVVPQVVPFPAPLETPPVLHEFNEARFRVMASMSPVEMN